MVTDMRFKPVSKIAMAAWVLASVLFFVHAIMDGDGFLILDNVNLPFHEFGHLLFNPFGETIGYWGGTIFQLTIPLVILISFLIKGETLGMAFGALWFGENFLNIAVYVADARTMYLPLVGGGEHDWNIILGGLGLLQYDAKIAAALKIIGWLIMSASVLWVVLMSFMAEKEQD